MIGAGDPPKWLADLDFNGDFRARAEAIYYNQEKADIRYRLDMNVTF